MRKAWIVVYIDTSVSPAAVRGAGVFGEPYPTTTGWVRTFPYMDFDGEDFEAAAKAAESYLAMPHMGWLGILYYTPRGLVRRSTPELPPWAKCLLLNLASVVWFTAGQQAESEMMTTGMLSYSNWKEEGIFGGGMSGEPVPVTRPCQWGVKRHPLEATNPQYVEGGYGCTGKVYAAELVLTEVQR